MHLTGASRNAGYAMAERDAADTEQILAAAFAHHQAGRLDAAEHGYKTVLKINPDHADALHLSGLICFQGGAFAEAERLIERALKKDGSNGLYLGNLGRIRKAMGDDPGAAAAYRAALAVLPEDAALWSDLAASLLAMDDGAGARTAAEQAVGLNARLPQAQLNLGLALRACAPPAGQEHAADERARSAFHAALRLEPGLAAAHRALGEMSQAAGELEAAKAAYTDALRYDPASAEAHCNLGNILRDEMDLDAAVAHYRAGLEVQPDAAEIHGNLGVALHELGRFGEALDAYDAALARMPDLAEVRRNRAMTLLLLGRYDEGWQEYEWRWKTKRFQGEATGITSPRWDGGPADKEHILVHAEQGLGDTLQFVRYLPLVKARGVSVTLRCPGSLVRLLSTVSGADAVVSEDDPVPVHDRHIPLMSLPHLFRTTAETIPASLPYLTAPPTEAARWAEDLKDLSGPKIGLAWKGSPRHPRDRVRSPGLEVFLPLFEGGGRSFVSLQKEGGADDIGRLGVADLIFDPTASVSDFADTAAIVKNLDVVVCCDTAVAHLAGGLGCRVLLMLPWVAEWRWRESGAACPWYPDMHLIRQTSANDWTGVLSTINSLIF